MATSSLAVRGHYEAIKKQERRPTPAPPITGRASGRQPSASPPAGSRGSDKTTAKRILWIDDEPDLMSPFAPFLKREGGFEVEFAVTAQAGLERARARQHDLILLDLRLPGANDLDLLRALLQLVPAVPIIVVTAYGTIDSAHRAGALGAAGFVSKPMRPAELLTAISKELYSPSERRPKSAAEQEKTSPLLRLCRELRLISASEWYWDTDNRSASELHVASLLAKAAADPAATLLEFRALIAALREIMDAQGRLTADDLRRVGSDLAAAVGTDQTELDPTIRSLLDNLAEAESIAMAKLRLAKAAPGRAPSTRYRTIRRDLHERPDYWRQLAVLRRAARLLAEADEYVSQVAYSLGYQDESSLTHLFKNHLGLAPREYRRLIRSGRCTKNPREAAR